MIFVYHFRLRHTIMSRFLKLEMGYVFRNLLCFDVEFLICYLCTICDIFSYFCVHRMLFRNIYVDNTTCKQKLLNIRLLRISWALAPISCIRFSMFACSFSCFLFVCFYFVCFYIFWQNDVYDWCRSPVISCLSWKPTEFSKFCKKYAIFVFKFAKLYKQSSGNFATI